MSGSSDYTRTPNLALYKPISSRAVGTWGDLWNSNADALDSAIHFASGGGPFLPLAGGTVFGPLNWTSTGSTTSRSAQDRSSDTENVLDYGAQHGTGFDSAPAINAACATAAASGSDVFIPAGTYLVNSQINVLAGTVLRGAGRHATTLFVTQAFSPTDNGVLSLFGYENQSPEVRDLSIMFQQPTDTVTTTTASSASGTNTITVASVAGIAVNNYLNDVTVAGYTAIPFMTKVQSIAGNVLTLTKALVGTVNVGDSIHLGPSRANMMTLAAGGTSVPGGTGVMYPWAIFAPNSVAHPQTGRYIIRNVSVYGAWGGIYSGDHDNVSNVAPWIENIEMGCLTVGLQLNGGLDFAHIKGWHSWGFQQQASVGYYLTQHDAITTGIELGRQDGLNATDINLFIANLHVTADYALSVPATFTNLIMDSGRLIIESGMDLRIVNGVFGGFVWANDIQTSVPQWVWSGGSTTFTNCWFNPNGSASPNPYATVTGGQFRLIGCSCTAGTYTPFSHTGGTFQWIGCYISPAPTVTAPMIQSVGGLTMIGCHSHSGVGGTLVTISGDGPDNCITGNDFKNYSVTIPAVSPLIGTYNIGTNAAYGQQWALGRATQGGRLDFKRGSDGAATAWIGMNAAAGTNLVLTNTSGSSQIILNAVTGGANVFQLGGTEYGRIDANGLGLAKIAAAPSAPGATLARLAFVTGTTAGTGKLVAYCGTSNTPVTIVDNIGAGF